MNLLDKFHFKDKNGIVTTMKICDSFSRSKIAQILGMIPTKTSQLQNDSGFITSGAIPTNVSAFNNDAGYIKESVGVGSPFRKIKVGDLAITHGMTAAENYPITNSAGSLYFYDKTISIPSNARLSTLYDVNVTPLGNLGCIGAMVISASTSSITIRVFNNASASVSLRMNITMIGE